MFRSYVDRWRHKIRIFAVEIVKNAKKKSAAELCQILRVMVTVKIVINSTRIMGVHVTISGRYCIAFEVMLLFLVVFLTSLPES